MSEGAGGEDPANGVRRQGARAAAAAGVLRRRLWPDGIPGTPARSAGMTAEIDARCAALAAEILAALGEAAPGDAPPDDAPPGDAPPDGGGA